MDAVEHGGAVNSEGHIPEVVETDPKYMVLTKTAAATAKQTECDLQLNTIHTDLSYTGKTLLQPQVLSLPGQHCFLAGYISVFKYPLSLLTPTKHWLSICLLGSL